jgi:hypothetical protein
MSMDLAWMKVGNRGSTGRQHRLQGVEPGVETPDQLVDEGLVANRLVTIGERVGESLEAMTIC